MAKFKTYDYRQRVLLPVSLEDQLMPGTLEFAMHNLVEKRLNMSIFEGKYRNDETGLAAYDPKILLKVVCWPIPGGWFLLERSNKPAGRTWFSSL
jgi:hypothetical protein